MRNHQSKRLTLTLSLTLTLILIHEKMLGVWYSALGVRKAGGFSQFAQKLGKSSSPNFVNFLVTLRPNMMIFFNNI